MQRVESFQKEILAPPKLETGLHNLMAVCKRYINTSKQQTSWLMMVNRMLVLIWIQTV